MIPSIENIYGYMDCKVGLQYLIVTSNGESIPYVMKSFPLILRLNNGILCIC